ncbi:MAG: hypothetical protein ACTSP1_17355 [Candidatus Freyarchaeota archaeon]
MVREIGAPIASALARGYVEEKRGTPQPPQQRRGLDAQMDLSTLPDSELQKRWNQIQTAKTTLQQYESKFLEELEKRGRAGEKEKKESVPFIDVGGDIRGGRE